ncbi:ribokinase [Actinomyces ruminicola]|uniref:Ribokinase n=1 Tax=Actinomyces ruminicola TaxID=332524 RepID=A0A1H0BZM6_9ACTO|nr:ribokinase [Actinomyces ruminicola]SDN51131.1 ribokinase [Actinomyces ruminicola]
MTAPTSTNPNVTVVGSLNTDFTVRVERLPRPGETLCVPDAVMSFGGKGANQAVQLARLGLPVTFVGAVGADDRGREYVDRLKLLGMEMHVARIDGAATGLGFVHCMPDGTVSSTVIAGANARVTAAMIDEALTEAPRPALILTQNEVPTDAVVAAGRWARRHQVLAVINAAPHVSNGDELLGLFDYFIVNEEEALGYAGRNRAPQDVAGWLGLAEGLRRIAPNVVITLGAQGAVYAGPGGVLVVPARRVDAVDTTGAGDSFVGALCGALATDETIEHALECAARAGAMTTLGVGAQESMPEAGQVFGAAAAGAG